MRLLKKSLGKVFRGVVVRTAPIGVFVELEGTGAQGLARGASARLGDKVAVVIEKVDEESGEIDLRIKR